MEMCKETRTNDDVMCLDFGEDVAPTTCNDSASVEEMEGAERMCENGQKMCRKFDRSMSLSMHWIMQDWRLKTRILGTIHFPPKHTTTNISDSLLNARIDFDVCPKSAESRIPQSEESPRSDKLAHFVIQPFLDRSGLTSDCGSDVSAEAEKDHFSGLQSLCISLFEHSRTSSYEKSCL